MTETNEPMGGNLPEDFTPVPQAQHVRDCWAIEVLVREVTELFDTGHYAHSPNWLAANKVVVFTPAKKEWDDMALVMPELADDERVESLDIDAKAKTITVKIVDNAILYDTRDSFGLDNAVLGLDREITFDDLTPTAAALTRGDEGFVEGSL